MKKNLKWYSVNKKYVEYLRKTDKRVQFINYNNQFKPYVGIIIHISKWDYYVPISSVGNKINKLEKYKKMKDDIDLFKIYDKNNKLLAVLNLNNMIPVKNDYVEEIKYAEIDKYRKFKDDEERKKYIYLLQRELIYLRKNQDIIANRAKKLYIHKIKYPFSRISKRTCDFNILEQKCNDYN